MSTARYRFDVLARAVEGVQERTVGGAIVTVSSVALIVVLVVLEIKSFLTASAHTHIGVDDGDKPFGLDRWTLPDRLPVRVHMTFAHLQCESLMLEVDSTRSDFEPLNSVEFREPTAAEMAWVGEDVDRAQACTLDGKLTIGKVSANFHVEVADKADDGRPLAGASIPLSFSAYAHQIAAIERRKHLNISHKVHLFHFGDRVLADTAAPLDGVVNAPRVAGQQHYLLKVIPTLLDRGLVPVATNQYSLAEQFVPFDLALPASPTASVGVWFYYDFSPVIIQVHHNRPSFAEFLVSICAIVGGVFAVSSIIDGIIFRGAKVLSVKHD
mmetsp:Transcript_1500/g.4507  ORF Transcript_1500/g.4507 Transcript_1500/m.4507 type:complete len:326 (-) Transcript_1500:89-1066(-)